MQPLLSTTSWSVQDSFFGLPFPLESARDFFLFFSFSDFLNFLMERASSDPLWERYRTFDALEVTTSGGSSDDGCGDDAAPPTDAAAPPPTRRRAAAAAAPAAAASLSPPPGGCGVREPAATTPVRTDAGDAAGAAAPPVPAACDVDGVAGEEEDAPRASYEGDVSADGLRHGRGRAVYPNGSVYDGEVRATRSVTPRAEGGAGSFPSRLARLAPSPLRQPAVRLPHLTPRCVTLAARRRRRGGAVPGRLACAARACALVLTRLPFASGATACAAAWAPSRAPPAPVPTRAAGRAT